MPILADGEIECQRDLLFEILTRPGHSVTDIRRTVKAGHWVVSTQIARSREGIEVQADSNTGMSGCCKVVCFLIWGLSSTNSVSWVFLPPCAFVAPSVPVFGCKANLD
jgi:hypothetical protein